MNPNCANCPLLTHPYVEGDGNQKCCKVMVVGAAPGEVEEHNLRTFSGASGLIVRELMSYLNLTENAFFTNVLKRKSDEKPTRKECYRCGSHLIEEIVQLTPQVVIVLGQMPLEFFMSSTKYRITTMHGLTIPMAKFAHEFILIPSFDPGYVARRGGLDGKIGNDFIHDFFEAKQILNGETAKDR